jgi:hypothetical protein
MLGSMMWYMPFMMNWRCRAVNREGFRCGAGTGLFSSYCEHHRDGKWREALHDKPKDQEAQKLLTEGSKDGKLQEKLLAAQAEVDKL